MTSTTRTQALVISWSGLLNQLITGRVTLDQLDGALFYLGCARRHVFDHGVGGEDGEMQYSYEQGPDQCTAIYEAVCRILLDAEAEGRVVWRQEWERNSWEQLNELLSANGLPTITRADTMDGQYYTHHSVHEAVRAQEVSCFVISTSLER